MMKLRQQGDDEYKKYDIDNHGNFDSELLERKMRKGQAEGYQRREEKRQDMHMRRQQKVLNKCTLCFYQEGKFDDEMVIAESDHCYLAFPTKTSPLHPLDKDPFTHLVLAPKQHYVNCLEIDEQTQTEMRNFQKSIVAFFSEVFNMQSVFLETCI
jgi:hypothetical protein